MYLTHQICHAMPLSDGVNTTGSNDFKWKIRKDQNTHKGNATKRNALIFIRNENDLEIVQLENRAKDCNLHSWKWDDFIPVFRTLVALPAVPPPHSYVPGTSHKRCKVTERHLIPLYQCVMSETGSVCRCVHYYYHLIKQMSIHHSVNVTTLLNRSMSLDTSAEFFS